MPGLAWMDGVCQQLLGDEMTDDPNWSTLSLVRNPIKHPTLSHCSTDSNPGLGGDLPEEDLSSHQEHAQMLTPHGPGPGNLHKVSACKLIRPL